MKKIILIHAGTELLEIPDIFFRASILWSFNAQYFQQSSTKSYVIFKTKSLQLSIL